MSRVSRIIKRMRGSLGPVPVHSLAVHTVMHCNLSCRGCNHASPLQEESLAEPEQIERDLRRARRVVHSRLVRVMGGEPLLHPRIDDVLQIIKDSRITDQIVVVTNGTLMGKMTDRFWSLADLLHVSRYPGVPLHVPARREAKVQFKDFPEFHETYSTIRNDVEGLVRTIYDACTIKQGCYGLAHGRFFRCMRAAYLPRAIGLPDDLDGVPLGNLTRRGLRAHLKEDRPLKSCAYCTGSSGKSYPHQQLPARVWLTYQNRPIAHMI